MRQRFTLCAVALAAALLNYVAWAADVRVIDGDTLEVAGERVRLVNIDAPEINGKCTAEIERAQAAKRFLADAVAAAGGAVELERVPRKDRYGRTLAFVRVNGRDVGEQLIAAGLARPWRGKRERWC